MNGRQMTAVAAPILLTAILLTVCLIPTAEADNPEGLWIGETALEFEYDGCTIDSLYFGDLRTVPYDLFSTDEFSTVSFENTGSFMIYQNQSFDDYLLFYQEMAEISSISMTMDVDESYNANILEGIPGDLTAIYSEMGHSLTSDVVSTTAEIELTCNNYNVVWELADKELDTSTTPYMHIAREYEGWQASEYSLTATIHYEFTDTTSCDVTVVATSYSCITDSASETSDFHSYTLDTERNGTVTCNLISVPYHFENHDESDDAFDPGSRRTSGIIAENFEAIFNIPEMPGFQLNIIEHSYLWDSIIDSGLVDDYYEISFVDWDDSVICQQRIPDCALTTYDGDEPARAADVANTYEFSGWDDELSVAHSNKTYKAVYTPTPKTYTITFANWDDTVLQQGPVTYGSTPVYSGQTPSKESDSANDYSFSGWDSQISPVNGAKTYKATFSTIPKDCTVRFLNWNGDVLQSGTVAYGGVPRYDGNTPVKESDVENDYVFSGWDKELAAVTKDTDFTAQFDAVPSNRCSATFYTDSTCSEIFESAVYESGSVLRLPSGIPQKDGMAFTGWHGYIPGMITSNMSFYAEYSAGETTVDGDNITTVVESEDGSRTTTNYNTADGTSTVKEESAKTTVAEGDKSMETTSTVEKMIDDTGSIVSTTTITKSKETVAGSSRTVETQKVEYVSGDSEIKATAVVTSDGSQQTAKTNADISANPDAEGTADIKDADVDKAIELLSAVSGTSQSASKTVTVSTSVVTGNKASANISSSSLKSVGDNGASFSMNSNVGSILLNPEIISGMTGGVTDSNVSLGIANVDAAALNDEQKKTVGNSKVISLSASVGGTSVHKLGGIAVISIPYALSEGEDADTITVYYLNDAGETTKLNTRYDAATGMVSFETDHFSLFFVSGGSDVGNVLIYAVLAIVVIEALGLILIVGRK